MRSRCERETKFASAPTASRPARTHMITEASTGSHSSLMIPADASTTTITSG